VRTRAQRTYRLLGLALLLAALCSLLFFPVDVIFVGAQSAPLLSVDRISKGDSVTLAHVNSIYNERVEELLSFDGSDLMLADVKTASYGVKEYYRITEGIEKRTFRRVTFMNSASGQFQLLIKGRDVEGLSRFADQRITFGITHQPLAYYLSWRLFGIFPGSRLSS
jgi:hypothetical protein